MRSRHGGFHRTASSVGGFLLACSLLAVGHLGVAADSACGYGPIESCCASPRLETAGGWSLFWHDPCSTPTYCWAGERYSHEAEAPRVYAMVDALALTRDQFGSTVYQAAALNEITTYRRDPVLGTSSFDDEFQPGIRALIGVSLSDWYRIECSYLGSYSWSDSAAVRYDASDNSGNLLSPFSDFGDKQGRPGLDRLAAASFEAIPGLDYNEFASIRYASQLDNAELNVRRRVWMPHDPHWWGEISCLVGLRYMNVDEEFGYLTVSTNPSGTQNAVDVHTANDLFGVQIGALAQLLVHNRAWFDVQVKGGLLLNGAETRIDANVNKIPSMPSDEINCTSFVGDLSVQFNYQFAPSWTFHAGYNAMWLTGVALASENFSSNVDTLVYGPASVDHSGNVVYHGPNIGLVWTR